MRKQKSVERRLAQLERELERQTLECMEKGYNSPASLFLDKRYLERHTLRWVLRKPFKAYNAADVMAGW